MKLWRGGSNSLQAAAGLDGLRHANSTLRSAIERNVGKHSHGHDFLIAVAESFLSSFDMTARTSVAAFSESLLGSVEQWTTSVSQAFEHPDFTEVLQLMYESQDAKGDSTTGSRFLNGYTIRPKGSRFECMDHALEVRMELMTACWICLYFCFIRCDLIWSEVVKNFAEETHGIPDGICTAKFSGDVYRKTRRILPELKKMEVDTEGLNLRVRHLALDPYLLKANTLPGDFNNPMVRVGRDLSPAYVRDIGARYQIAQQVAYLLDQDRATIIWKYGIPSELENFGQKERDWLAKALNLHARSKAEPPWAATVKLADPLQSSAGTFADEAFKMAIWAAPNSYFGNMAMPACVLGVFDGMYTIHSPQVMPFSGRPVDDSLFQSMQYGLMTMAKLIRKELKQGSGGRPDLVDLAAASVPPQRISLA